MHAFIWVLATAYCSGTTTATGLRVRPGIVAVDPNVIPLGTRMSWHGQQWRAEDTGGDIIGDRIDIYMHSCRAAIDWGARTIRIQLRATGR